ncbi:MAG TPA: tripartite tricarboxylate transporter substrate binding protein [Burkholderiaceae bacterium]|jgi:tripartite-type tricarboxylate transporter receptor subunit TctC
MRRLRFLSALALGPTLAASAFRASAQAPWSPNKPSHLISPYAAGGTNDLLARLLAQKLSERLGESVIVDNRAGANGIIGSDLVAKSPADGYALLMGNSATHGINPGLYPKLPYNAVRDFTPIGLMATVPLLLIVSPSLGVSNLKELVALAKAKPHTLSVASSGIGSSPHLASELFKSAAGIDLVHVPYKGDLPAITDVMGGQVTMFFANMPSAVPFVQSGKLKALAMTAPHRASALADIPTMAEAGVNGVEIQSWYGLMAPAKLPADVMARLDKEFQAVMQLPDVQARIRQLGAEPANGTQAQFQRFVGTEVDKYAKIIKASGIVLE